MDKLLRVFFYLGFIAFAAGLPNAASADIEVTISDQVTTITSASGNPGFNLKWITTSSTGAGHSATWNLLKCSPHPCSVFFPSGGTTPKPGVDTFEFRDTCPDPSTCSFGAGRVEKWDDSMLAGIELKGIRITALPGVTSRWVTVTITTEVKDFLALSPGTHTVWGLLDGTFTEQPPKPGGDKLSLACPKPADVNEANVLKPCAELALVVYRIEPSQAIVPIKINGDGDLSIFTVSLPCMTSGGINNPCGSGGTYDGDGLFFTVDFDPAVTCPGSANCPIFQGATYTAQFLTKDQTFQLYDSAIAAVSRRTADNFGLADLASSLAYEFRAPFWVWYSAAKELYRVIPQTPEISASAVRIAFQLQQGRNVPAKNGVLLTSIGIDNDVKAGGKNGDNALPPSERIRNDRSYASYIAKPGTLHWSDVDELILDYDVLVGSVPSGDPRLGALTFSDCSGASFYVQVALANKAGPGKDDDILKIRLGSTDQFAGGCREAQKELSGQNLVKKLLHNEEKRVDASVLPTTSHAASPSLNRLQGTGAG